MSPNNHQLHVGTNLHVASTAILDTSSGPIIIGDNVTIGHYTIIHPNTVIGDEAHIGAHASIGIPEHGYAMGQHRHGQPGAHLGPGTTIRDGVHLYGGVHLGTNVAIGHHSLCRTNVHIGDESQIAHFVSIERGTQLGRYVRSSPQTHLTGDLIAEDRVFFGAGVKTVNDRAMTWRTGQPIELAPLVFRHGASIGSGSTIGSTIGAGVEIGTWALVGSHSLVLNDVPPYAIVIGAPARYLRDRNQPL